MDTVCIPAEILKAAINLKNRADRALLAIILPIAYGIAKGQPFAIPIRPTAREAGISLSSVQRAIASLVGGGFLARSGEQFVMAFGGCTQLAVPNMAGTSAQACTRNTVPETERCTQLGVPISVGVPETVYPSPPPVPVQVGTPDPAAHRNTPASDLLGEEKTKNPPSPPSRTDDGGRMDGFLTEIREMVKSLPGGDAEAAGAVATTAKWWREEGRSAPSIKIAISAAGRATTDRGRKVDPDRIISYVSTMFAKAPLPAKVESAVVQPRREPPPVYVTFDPEQRKRDMAEARAAVLRNAHLIPPAILKEFRGTDARAAV